MRILSILAITVATSAPAFAMQDIADRQEAKAATETVTQDRMVQPADTSVGSMNDLIRDRNR